MTTYARRSPLARRRQQEYQMLRRDANRDAQRCINDNAHRTHGPAMHGCRCAACAEVHRRSA